MPAKHLIGLGIGLSPNSTRFFITMGFGDADVDIASFSISTHNPLEAVTSVIAPMVVTNNSRAFASITNGSR